MAQQVLNNGETHGIFRGKINDNFTEVYNKANTNASDINDITNYVTVAAVADVYTINIANRPIKNIRMTTPDAMAKTVTLSNVPLGDCELFIELTYTNSAAITWFAGITWLNGSAPVFTAGKVYRIALFYNATAWHGVCVGGW